MQSPVCGEDYMHLLGSLRAEQWEAALPKTTWNSWWVENGAWVSNTGPPASRGAFGRAVSRLKDVIARFYSKGSLVSTCLLVQHVSFINLCFSAALSHVFSVLPSQPVFHFIVLFSVPLLHLIIYVAYPYHNSNLTIGSRSILTLSFNWLIQWVALFLLERLSISNTVQ